MICKYASADSNIGAYDRTSTQKKIKNKYA